MIENVLEIKDTYVREVMTPLVDVVAIDASATLVDFNSLWVTHQYSRYIETSWRLYFSLFDLQFNDSLIIFFMFIGYLFLSSVLII